MQVELDETHPNTLFYTVEQKPEGRFLLARFLLVFGYVAFAALFFFVCYITAFIPLCALLPLWCWMLVYFTFHRTTPTYVILLQAGRLNVYRRLRKKDTLLFSAPLADAAEITACHPGDRVPEGYRLRDYRGNVAHTPSCLLLFPGKDRTPDTAVLLPATQKMLRQFRLYNRAHTILQEQDAGQ